MNSEMYEKGKKARKTFNNASFTERTLGNPGHTHGKSKMTKEERSEYSRGKKAQGNRR